MKTTVNFYNTACENCGEVCDPINKALCCEDAYGTFPVKMFRYECPCGRYWADAEMRKHNAKVYKEQKKKHYNQSMGFLR